MLLAGTLLMGFWLFLVGGLQGTFGDWGVVDGNCTLEIRFNLRVWSANSIFLAIWVVSGHDSITKGIIVSSYLFVCRYAGIHNYPHELASDHLAILVSLLPWVLSLGLTLPNS